MMNLVRATRQAIERRMSISEFDAMLDMFHGGGTPTYTGKFVGPRNALAVQAFWACVNVLADDWATLPVLPYRWTEPGVSRTEARDHYLWPLLTEEANSRMSAHDFKRQMEVWRQCWGNCYAEVEMNGRGQITNLWPWHPERVKVWLKDPNDVRSEVYYTYIPRDRSVKPITVSQHQMLHVKHLSLDGLVGLSPVEVHRQAMALRLAKTEFSARFYGNGASIKGTVTVPNKLSEKAEKSLRESLDNYRGLENAHRLLILEDGMSYKDTVMPLKDAQFIESMRDDDEGIARIMKVPQHRIGLLDRATNNNIVQQSMEYVQYTLGPNAANWCGRFHCSLLSERERDSIFLEPNYDYLLQGDPQMRAQLYTVLASHGAFSPDDIRHGEKKNPLPKGLGKLPRVPLNTAPIGSEQANNPPASKPAEPKTEPAKPNSHAALQ